MDLETRESLIARLPDHADHAAWHEFAELYEPLIYGIGRRHGLQPADASDLVQEVFTAVAGSIDRFEPDQTRGRFRTWLFRVAQNHALTHIRRLKRDGHITGDSATANTINNIIVGDSSVHEFESAFRRRAFRWAARRVRDSVAPNTWEAFSRTAIDGQEPKLAASEMGIEVGAVYLARSRVMNRLRGMVENVSHESFDNIDDSSEIAS